MLHESDVNQTRGRPQLAGEDLTSLPGADTTYSYDNNERLTHLNSTSTWTYDNADNLTKTTAGDLQHFNDADQLCYSVASGSGSCASPPSGATTYSYDARGNRTAMTPPSPATATNYTYDQANRLTGIDTADATYGYGPDGLRTTKTVSSQATSYVWDKAAKDPLLVVETEGSNSSYYLYGPGDEPYAQIANDTTTTTYLHHDQLGSIRLLTDSSGSQTGAATYDAYGTLSASSGTLSHLGYAGQYTDTESGILYLRRRNYDPSTGQFLEKDPLAQRTRLPYGYVNGSPLNSIDPSGLICLLAARNQLDLPVDCNTRTAGSFFDGSEHYQDGYIRKSTVRHILSEGHFGGLVNQTVSDFICTTLYDPENVVDASTPGWYEYTKPWANNSEGYHFTVHVIFDPDNDHVVTAYITPGKYDRRKHTLPCTDPFYCS